MQSNKSIDIRKLAEGKSRKLAKRIPGFVYRWLHNKLHLDEINPFLEESGDFNGVDFLNATVRFIGVDYLFHNEEYVPRDDKQRIYVSNHPLGGLDGVLLLKYLNENQGKTRGLVNDFLMALKPLREFFVPINKVGGQARGSIQKIDELYESKDNVLVFPAGLCSRKRNGKIADLEWQKHFIQKALQYKLDVVPIYFDGRNSNFFYNLARVRKFLHIKVNIEMLYLVDEMFKHRGKKFDVYFGKPISYETFDKTKSQKEWAAEVKSIVYGLAHK